MTVIDLAEFKKLKWGREKLRMGRVGLYRLSLLSIIRATVRKGRPVSPNIIILFAESYKKLGEPIPPDWIEKAERAKKGEAIYFRRRSDRTGVEE
jgi:hypothetical protein